MKITKNNLKQVINEELKSVLDEGFMDRFKSKATAKLNQATTGGVAGVSTQSMGQFQFSAKTSISYAKRLEKMAQEIEKDIQKMGFDKSDQLGLKENVQEIAVILREAAAALGKASERIQQRKEDSGEF